MCCIVAKVVQAFFQNLEVGLNFFQSLFAISCLLLLNFLVVVAVPCIGSETSKYQVQIGQIVFWLVWYEQKY